MEKTKEKMVKSTPAMDEYIQLVFGKVMDLYKEVAPELVSQALGVEMNEVSSISNKEIMEKLNNMIIDYKLVDNPDDVNISYRDNIRNNEIAKITGAHTSNDPNKLVMHLFEPEVSAHSSTRELLNMTDKDGIPKVLSDINYISHEMGHAFEHILKAQNPSYIDYGALKIEKNFKRSA